jgi:threonine synthase
LIKALNFTLMRLYSTKNLSTDVSFEEAVIKGLPEDNGLFMPKEITQLPESFFERLPKMSMGDIAWEVSRALIGDEIPADVLERISREAANFPAPIVKVDGNIYALELFHGPTLAFKDFGARFMARTMSYFMRNEKRTLHILVATSGDTGGAVGHGFLGVENIHVTILYPKGKVSFLQEKQLTTLGQNVTAIEVDGTFDDCQALVKQAFLDKELNELLLMSSANSINISRLIPQSFYYFYAYAQAQAFGRPVVFSVPSGNFGNICGGIIASKMGLPIKAFVAATNANSVFTEFVRHGHFQPRPSVKTLSNAMDVGNPSNFPRAFGFFENDLHKLRLKVAAYSYTDQETCDAMRKVEEGNGYIMDPHGAIGYLGLKDFFKQFPMEATGIFLETAHPAKFLDVVNATLDMQIPVPEALQVLANRPKQAQALGKDFEGFKAFLKQAYA